MLLRKTALWRIWYSEENWQDAERVKTFRFGHGNGVRTLWRGRMKPQSCWKTEKDSAHEGNICSSTTDTCGTWGHTLYFLSLLHLGNYFNVVWSTEKWNKYVPLPITITALEYFLSKDLKALLFVIYLLTLCVLREGKDYNDHPLCRWWKRG